MDKKWIIRKEGGEAYGPVGTDEVKIWISEQRILEDDWIAEDNSSDWKRVLAIEEFSACFSSPQPVESEAPTGHGIQPEEQAGQEAVAGTQTTVVEQEVKIDKYAIGFGLLNILIGGFMFFGGIVQGSRVLSLLVKEGRHLRGLGQIIKVAAIFGLIVTTVLWLPLFVSGILILIKKSFGRKLAVTSGQILTYAIPISFFLSSGFGEIFSLYGLIVAILFVYVFIMWQNLVKPEFDNWFAE